MEIALTSAIFFGMLIGGLLAGFFGDKFGRKIILLFSLFLSSTGGIIGSWAPSFIAVATFRGIAGIGIGGTVPAIWTYVSEMVPPNKRGCLVSMIGWFGLLDLYLLLR